MFRALTQLLLLVWLALSCAACAGGAQSWVELKGERYDVELAMDDATRIRGLMFRDQMVDTHGMLFVFERQEPQAFWMRNTRLPLSIAYLDEDGTFVSSTDMEPCPDTTSDGDCPRYPADGPFAYAVEVPQGGLADLLLVEGSSLRVDPGPCPLR